MKLRMLGSMALLAAPFLMTACSNKSKKSDGNAGGPPPPPAEETPPPTEPATAQDPGGSGDPNPQTPPPSKFVPPRFALALPGALRIGPDAESSLRLQDEEYPSDETISSDEVYNEIYPDPESDTVISEPGTASPQGSSELSYQIESLSRHLEMYSQEFSALDQLFLENAKDCFEDGDGCLIEGAKAEFTKEMATETVEDLGGEGALGDAKVKSVSDEVGQTIILGTVKVDPAPKDSGFTWIVTLDNGFGRTLTISWLQDKDAEGNPIYPHVMVSEDAKGSYEVPGAEKGGVAMLADSDPEEPLMLPPSAPVENYAVSYRVEFREAEGAMSVFDNSQFGSWQYNNTFFFVSDRESKENGAGFSVELSTSGPVSGRYFSKINGYADNLGAYLQTLYSYDEASTTLTLSGPAAIDTYYEIYPAKTNPADLTWENNRDLMLGWVSVPQGGDPTTITGTFYTGPEGSGLDLPLFTPNFDDNGTMSYTDSMIKVSSATTSFTRAVYGYTETYTVDQGQLAGGIEFCWYIFDATVHEWPAKASDFPNDCSSGWQAALEAGYAEAFEGEVGSGGVAPIGFVELGIGGNITFAVLEGAPLYLIPGGDGLSGRIAALNNALTSPEPPADGEDPMAMVLGIGTFVGVPDGDYANYSPGEINQLYSFQYWVTPEELAGAVFLKLVMDAETGVYYFARVEGAEVVLREVTEDNAKQDMAAYVDAAY